MVYVLFWGYFLGVIVVHQFQGETFLYKYERENGFFD